jgi:hypothetical protein
MPLRFRWWILAALASVLALSSYWWLSYKGAEKEPAVLEQEHAVMAKLKARDEHDAVKLQYQREVESFLDEFPLHPAAVSVARTYLFCKPCTHFNIRERFVTKEPWAKIRAFYSDAITKTRWHCVDDIYSFQCDLGEMNKPFLSLTSVPSGAYDDQTARKLNLTVYEISIVYIEDREALERLCPPGTIGALGCEYEEWSR